jgi:predicted transcriptional regulator
MDSSITPGNIEVLMRLRHHRELANRQFNPTALLAVGEPVAHAVQEGLRVLVEAGMIERSKNGYDTTEKGRARAMIESRCDVAERPCVGGC